MRSLLFCVTLALPTFLSPTHAEDLPKLSGTNLYKTIAHGCRPVALTAWTHPTKQVLLRYKVQLDSVELCNDNTYPIYHVRFRNDPTTSNTNFFFIPLYDDMLRANGRYPFAFVDPSWNWITYIDWYRGSIRELSDEYAP
ncbi:MAG: hypothetical protein ACLQL2_06375 [Methylovirgula sp.]